MLIKRNLHNIRCNNLDQFRPLRIITNLQQLLTQIIPERIRHQVWKIRFCTVIDNFDRFFVASLEFALEMTTAVLITTQVGDFGGEILDAGFRKDETFVVVASVAFVSSCITRRKVRILAVVERLGSILVGIVLWRLHLTSHIIWVIELLLTTSRAVIASVGGVFGWRDIG